MTAGPYAIGSAHWPGLSKLVEELGELGQVLGKIVATNGEADHWDGTNLHRRVEAEIADVLAAIRFTTEKWDLDIESIFAMADNKYATFLLWHGEQSA